MRSRLTKRLLTVGLIAAGAVIADRTGIVTAAGADVWNYPALEDELARHAEASEEMDRIGAVIDERIAVKDALIVDLLAGRKTLGSVAETFRTLNADQPEMVRVLERLYHTDDPHETAARNVYDYATAALQASPATRPAALARLRAEFAGLFPGASPLP